MKIADMHIENAAQAVKIVDVQIGNTAHAVKIADMPAWASDLTFKSAIWPECLCPEG